MHVCGGWLMVNQMVELAVLVAVVVAVVVVRHGAQCYNVDVSAPLVFTSEERGSLFGYTVTSYTDRHRSWILAGAPEARGHRSGAARVGKVYRCSADFERLMYNPFGGCRAIDFGEEQNAFRNGLPYDNKTGQWLGATIQVAMAPDRTPYILTCAPRYVWFTELGKPELRRETIGTCYLAGDNMKHVVEISPCRTAAFSYRRQGYCQAGFGAVFTQNGSNLVIGAPGSWSWQGQLYKYSIGKDRNKKAAIVQLENSTAEGPEKQDNSYLGLTLSTGELDGKMGDDIVVGAPRASQLTGMVAIYTSHVHSLKNISGSQIGSGFGHAVCVADVNSDGLDDIVVGAPYYIPLSGLSQQGGRFDVGRVTVFYQTAKSSFEKHTHIHGEMRQGRFGFSLASLADINLDGYADIAVGAPHTGMSEFGAVFIYHGSKRGLKTVPSQVIRPAQFGRSLMAFGYSVTGGNDLDGNGYPDVVVGALASESVVYFRSSPVLHVTASVRYIGVVGTGQVWNWTEKQALCPVQGALRPCLTARFCLGYSGVGVSDRSEFVVHVRLDSRRLQGSRLLLRTTSDRRTTFNMTMTVVRHEPTCTDIDMFIEELSLRDKLTPLLVQADYELVRQRSQRLQRHLVPVIDNTERTAVSDALYIQVNCGRNNVCVPDLKLDMRPSHAAYTVGSRDRLSLEVSVLNAGEDSFETMLYMLVPDGVDYVGTARFNDSTRSGIICALRTRHQNVLVCDLGNPLTDGSMVHFNISFKPLIVADRQLQTTQTTTSAAAAETSTTAAGLSYVFDVLVNSTNREQADTQTDNEMQVTIPVRVEAQLLAFGISFPESVEHNMTELVGEHSTPPLPPSSTAPNSASTINNNNGNNNNNSSSHTGRVGDEINHVYELINTGPSDVLAADVFVVWPTYTAQNEHLLYLMEQPTVEGPLNCDPMPDVNPLKLNIATDRSWPVTQAFIDQTVRNRASRALYSRPAQPYLHCGPTLCSVLRCRMTRFEAGSNAIVRVRAKIWFSTVDKIMRESSTDLAISSKLVVMVTRLPMAWRTDDLEVIVKKVTTIVLGNNSVPASIAWWIIALSTIGGLAVLLLVASLLYLVGFFKRTQQPQQQQQQQMPACGVTTSNTASRHHYSSSNGHSKLSNGHQYHTVPQDPLRDVAL